MFNKYILVSALCVPGFIQSAAGFDKIANASVSMFKQDQEVKTWCNGFLSGLTKASHELSSSHDADILKVYTQPSLATADDLLNNPSIVARILSLATQVYSTPSVMEAYCAASRGKSVRMAAQDRKKHWNSFRAYFGANVSEVVAPIINTDGQQYWHPSSSADQGATLFLTNNMHLKLTPEQRETMLAQSVLYFVARAVQRTNDLETDDQYALLSAETQKEWQDASA